MTLKPLSKLWSKSTAAEKFESMLRDSAILASTCQQEYRVVTGRRWRWDYAWPELLIAVEIDGFGFGHQTQKRISSAAEKQNAAVLEGWTVLRYTTAMISSRERCHNAILEVEYLFFLKRNLPHLYTKNPPKTA